MKSLFSPQASSAARKPTFFYVVGPPGVGKSTLLETFNQQILTPDDIKFQSGLLGEVFNAVMVSMASGRS